MLEFLSTIQTENDNFGPFSHFACRQKLIFQNILSDIYYIAHNFQNSC
jgi:excinuclease UvrABC nuclease subunit